MAGQLKTQKDWEEWDAERMASAVDAISRSEHLRFFIRSLLSAYGVNETPVADNALTTARLCGRHSAAMDIVATLLEHAPALWPALILEDQNEQAARNTAE